MSKTLIALLFFSTASLVHASEEQTFAVRRIAALWGDHEYDLVRSEIHNFFRAYPASEEMEHLQAVLGDASMALGHWDDAVAAYHEVVTVDLYERSFPNLIRAHFELGDTKQVQELAERFPAGDSGTMESVAQQAAAYYLGSVRLQAEEWEEAERIFLQLVGTPYRKQAQLHLATVYRNTDRLPRAVRVYKELAVENEQMKELFLFQAAQLEKEGNPSGAIQTLREVIAIDGERKPDAAWLEAGLLLQANHNEAIVERFSELEKLLPKEKGLRLSFYRSRSLILLKRYQEAVQAAERFIIEGSNEPGYHQAALLIGIAAAGKVGDLERVRTWSRSFEEFYPKESELPKAIFLRAMANKVAGNRQEALEDLNRLYTTFPQFSEMDDVAAERALVLYEMGELLLSRDAFLAFLESFPESPYRRTAHEYIISASLKTLERLEEGEEKIAMAGQVRRDMELSFSEGGQESVANRPQFLLRLATADVKMRLYEEAIPLLMDLVTEYPDHEELFQAHLLLATCYRMSREDIPAYVLHAEKSLALKPDQRGRLEIQRNLFSAFLAMGEGDPEGKAGHMERAAEVLYATYLEGKEPLEKERLIWLAEYYIEKLGITKSAIGIAAQEGDTTMELAKRSDALLRSVFGEGVALSETTMHLERPLLTWAKLLGWLGRTEEQVALLEQLVATQKENPEWSWQYSDKELVSLSSIYLNSGKVDEAGALLDELIRERRLRPAVAQQVKLLQARIAFRQLPGELHYPDHYRVRTITQALSDLQARRRLDAEPLHLEAAIDLAAIEASLAPKHDQTRVLLTGLQRVKEDFSQQDDIEAKEYHAQRVKDAQGDRIYQAYMMLIDGQIAYAQVMADKESGLSRPGDRRLEAATAIFEGLVEGKFAVSKYLIDQANWALQAIREERSSLIGEVGALAPGGVR